MRFGIYIALTCQNGYFIATLTNNIAQLSGYIVIKLLVQRLEFLINDVVQDDDLTVDSFILQNSSDNTARKQFADACNDVPRSGRDFINNLFTLVCLIHDRPVKCILLLLEGMNAVSNIHVQSVPQVSLISLDS